MLCDIDEADALIDRMTNGLMILSKKEAELINNPMALPFIYLKTMLRRCFRENPEDRIVNGEPSGIAIWWVPCIFELRQSSKAPLPWKIVLETESSVIYRVIAGNGSVVGINLNKEQANALIRYATVSV